MTEQQELYLYRSLFELPIQRQRVLNADFLLRSACSHAIAVVPLFAQRSSTVSMGRLLLRTALCRNGETVYVFRQGSRWSAHHLAMARGRVFWRRGWKA